MGQILEALKLPRVIGEICAGFVLGPSLLGALMPDVYQWIFRAFEDQTKLLSVFYWLGLILLMFSAGFKVSTTFAKGDHGLVLRLIVGGIGLPFLFGFSASSWIPNQLTPNPLAFSLIIAIAMTVTSIPVLTKIFMDLGIGSSRFARLALTASALQDLLLWTILSVALAFQQGQIVDGRGLLPEVAGTFAFAAFAIFVAPPLVRLTGRMFIDRSPEEALIGYTLLVCMVLVSVASILHVNIVFGALLAGLVVGRFRSVQMDMVRRAITNVAAWFFVPIYFALVGLQMNLQVHLNVGLLLAFLFASSGIKVASVLVATRTVVPTWKHALDYGVVMNARGGPGIVLASLAFAASIIDEDLFVALVLTSILTSLMAGVWLRRRLDRDAVSFR
jgi:Kef-type K+ transport system membrane component KefB